MIKITIEIEENDEGLVNVLMDVDDEEDSTDNEYEVSNDILNTVDYLINGDEVEDTIDEISENMFNQNKEV